MSSESLKAQACRAATKLLWRLFNGEEPAREEWLQAAAPWCAIGERYNEASFGLMLLEESTGYVARNPGAPARLDQIVNELFPEAE